MHFTPHISNAEMVPLCDALLVNASITRLDLSANNISNEGAKLLANVLKTRQNLKVWLMGGGSTLLYKICG
jgi:Ran GTPase-activating protein (RanGAP) involved in mRNA processing and transport